MWFRRDLRVDDHPALLRAAELGSAVAPIFVVDDVLARRSGLARATFLAGALEDLRQHLGGVLHVADGPPATALLSAARELGATVVIATSDATPYGLARDEQVAEALASEGIELQLVDSNYAVPPGVVRTQAGAPAKVFTAFRRGWEAVGYPAPYASAAGLAVVALPGGLEPSVLVERAQAEVHPWLAGLDLGAPASLPEPTAAAATAQLARFTAEALADYPDDRNVPGVEGTSRLSPYLRFGLIHPRSVLAAVPGADDGSRVFRSEICWREFYADVLYHQPRSAVESLQPALKGLAVEDGQAARAAFATWTRGETGYPIVDAGMRQLLEEGWMHNRVRMLVASFLVKSLHLDWRWGAAWFMLKLVDGDLASNQHGWQWTAGTGTDASPFHRIFNPTVQAERFDPEGRYVKRYVPELAAVEAPACLQPGGGGGMLAGSYPAPMVDHATERAEALARFASARDAYRASR